MLTPRMFQIQRNRMLNFYYVNEDQFMDLVKIVPLENHPSTFSPILYNILQSTCSQVENMMRLLCDYLQLKYKKKYK